MPSRLRYNNAGGILGNPAFSDTGIAAPVYRGTTITSGTAGNYSLNYPSGWQAGDVVLLCIAGYAGQTPAAPATPTGFTLLASLTGPLTNGFQGAMWVYSRTALLSDAGTISGVAPGNLWQAHCRAYQSNGVDNFITASAGANNVTPPTASGSAGDWQVTFTHAANSAGTLSVSWSGTAQNAAGPTNSNWNALSSQDSTTLGGGVGLSANATVSWTQIGISIQGVTTNTINFDAAPSFVTLRQASGNHIPLIIEPPQGYTPSSNFEIAWLTDYTAGASSGAVLRGQEGTSKIAHAAGVAWAHGPTAWDTIFGKGTDAPQAGSLGYDYEFLNPGSALPSGWTWTNQGAAVYTEYLKGGVLTNLTTNGSGSWNLILRNAPSPPFVLTAKLRFGMSGDNYPAAGIILTDANGKFLIFGSIGQSTFQIAASVWNSPTSFNANLTTALQNWTAPQYPFGFYVQATYTSATNVSFAWSPNGIVWIPLLSNYNPSGPGMGSVTQIGLGANSQNFQAMLDCEWFRVR